MTKEEIIAEIAIINANIGAIQDLIVQNNITTHHEINKLVKSSLNAGIITLTKIKEENVDSLKVLKTIQDQIKSL